MAPEVVSPERFEVEHIQPRRRGGADELFNLALSCGICNRRKASATQGIDFETRTVVGLFNPRRDDWETHFSIHFVSAGIEIVGLTPTGRATADRLSMNEGHAVHARQLWMLTGLFPP
jgi:hypothetical protein